MGGCVSVSVCVCVCVCVWVSVCMCACQQVKRTRVCGCVRGQPNEPHCNTPAETLELLEAHGGEDAFINIK